MERIIFVGLDVHSKTNSVCAMEAKRSSNVILSETTLPAGAEYILKYLKTIQKREGVTEDAFLIGYEAGPTGYVLCRALQKKGYCCQVIAPSTIQRASGERVKTDRLDARKLATALSLGIVKYVNIPDLEDESTKELIRTRNALAKHLKRAKQELLSFLLRMGMNYSDGEDYWTKKFMDWLTTVRFKDHKLQISFETYYHEVCRLQEIRDRMDAEIEEISQTPRYKEKVDKLVCFAGIETHTAVSLICEVGDFKRFKTPKEFASYLGLCPGQDSSGLRKIYKGITKTGNSRLRLLLIEATKGIKRANVLKKSKRIIERQRGQSPSVIAYADKATRRIKSKMKKLVDRGKHPNTATTAGARELANFIWGMMNDQIF